MKLGLIAMSGVRILNPRLIELGLNLPGFVERSKVIASLPSLGLLTLAALTPDEIDVSYIEVPELSEIEHLPGEFDVVAISSYSAKIHEAYLLADRYRAAQTKVILGGLHVSAMPDEAMLHADVIVIGEGENLWPQVMNDLQQDHLQPVYDSRGISYDLSASPIPRFEMLDIDRYNRLTVQTQRGCPFNCEFCASSIRISPKFKTKPVEKVIAEIRRIKQAWAHPFIEFADDNTFANRQHGKRLLRELTKEKVRWFTETDISVGEDEETLGLLRDSGCAQLLIGLESPGSRLLHGVEMKGDWKARQTDKYLDAIDRIQGHGVTVNGCFVLGLDGTEEDSFQEVFDFVRQSGLYEVQITVQTPFPGTPLYDRLRAEGRLLEPENWETCTLFDVNFKPDRMAVNRLEEKFAELMQSLYHPAFVAERRSRFHSHHREQLRLKKHVS